MKVFERMCYYKSILQLLKLRNLTHLTRGLPALVTNDSGIDRMLRIFNITRTTSLFTPRYAAADSEVWSKSLSLLLPLLLVVLVPLPLWPTNAGYNSKGKTVIQVIPDHYPPINRRHRLSYSTDRLHAWS